MRQNAPRIAAAVFVAALSGPVLAESRAPYKNEAEAAAAGRKLGIGSARLDGPKAVEVRTHQTWTLVYTAGKAGLAPGGGIRIGMRHLVRWTPPQTKSPKGAGYLTVKTPEGVTAKVGIGGSRYFREYFAWQNIVEVTVRGRALRPAPHSDVRRPQRRVAGHSHPTVR